MTDHVRHTTDLTKITDEQRQLVERVVKAHKRAQRAQSTGLGALAARDELIRTALHDGIGSQMLANQMGVHRSLIWKIEQQLTTRTLEQRRARAREGEQL